MDAFDESSCDEVECSVDCITADYEDAERDHAVKLARAQKGSVDSREKHACPSIRSTRPPGLRSEASGPGEKPRALLRGNLWTACGLRMFEIA